MKIYLLICIIVELFSIGDASIAKAHQYCTMNTCSRNQSIACEFISNSGMKCNGEIIPLNKNAILHQHNQLRSRIATGGLSPRFKSATKMAQMYWNDDLAQMAEYNVKRCIFGHDQCRNIKSFPISGQNLAIRKQIGIKNWNVHDNIQKSINSWFEEYKLTDMSVINNYHDTGRMIGHFTVMVKDSNTNVGCAATRYKSDGWDNILLACNYADTNIFGKPIYRSGKTASQCFTKSKKYKGLCARI